MGNTYTELLEAAGTIDHNNFRYINICNNIFSSQFGIAGWQISKAEAKRLGQPHYSEFLDEKSKEDVPKKKRARDNQAAALLT
jgi:hypothetical protein